VPGPFQLTDAWRSCAGRARSAPTLCGREEETAGADLARLDFERALAAGIAQFRDTLSSRRRQEARG
jgi:hypothetical protein